MNAPIATVAGDWTDLEQAFFDAAPPDEPEAPAEPAHFDDLLAAGPARRPAWEWFEPTPTKLRRLLEGGAHALEGWKLWVVLATGSLMVGLSAVFAAH